MTITEAIKEVMLATGTPMTAREAYNGIVAANLYEFHADNPEHIVRSQIRRHCRGLDFPSAAPTKHFKLVGENRYFPLDTPIRPTRKPPKQKKNGTIPSSKTPLAKTLAELQDLHFRYVHEIKKKILSDLKKLSPDAFERFAKKLIDVYGFHDTRVTQVSGDAALMGMGN
jgi:restriction system protein